MNTFDVKTVLMLCIIIIVLLSVSTVYLMDLLKNKDANYLLVPLIVGLILTLLRFYNNIVQKAKIVELLKNKKEDSLDESKISFTTCPEYWTKKTVNNTVYCHNNFTDIDDNKIIIGSDLTKDLDTTHLDTDLEEGDATKSIGFKINNQNKTPNDPSNTYIPTMRGNAEYPKSDVEEPVIEKFDEQVNPNTSDNTLHKHDWTYYAHKGDITWDKDTDFGEHKQAKYNDDDHLINVAYWHDHEGTSVGSDGKPLKMTADAADAAYVSQPFSNTTNWINPYLDKDTKLYAEINLTELNKTSNKCDLVNNFTWIEAKNKCANINKQFV
jgi:hypothetical protein